MAAVLGKSSGATGIGWYPRRKSIFEKLPMGNVIPMRYSDVIKFAIVAPRTLVTIWFGNNAQS